MTGGGLSSDGTPWHGCRQRFLFAVKALGAVFRGKYLAGLERLRRQQRLTFAGESAAGAESETWTALHQQLSAKPWVVYAKPPWGSPEQGLKYLSRYTHRVAIANSRLAFVGDGVVRFRYTDYAAGGITKVMELCAEEFLRRFLLHVVPTGFVRIRHSGVLANRSRQEKRARACTLSSRGHNVSPARGIGAGLGCESFPHRGRSLPSLCWDELADPRSAPAAERGATMISFLGPVQSTPGVSSLLVIFLLERTAFVYPPPRFPFGSQPSVPSLPPPVFSPASTTRRHSFLLPALTESISIGRGSPPR